MATESQGGDKEGGSLMERIRARVQKEEEEPEDEFDFIVDDHGQPIRRRKEDGTFTEP